MDVGTIFLVSFGFALHGALLSLCVFHRVEQFSSTFPCLSARYENGCVISRLSRVCREEKIQNLVIALSQYKPLYETSK